MYCSEVKNILDEYLDDSMAQGQALEVSEHVAACDACAAELNAHRSIRDLLQTLPLDGPDEDFLDRAIARAADATDAPTGRQDRRISDLPTTRRVYGLRVAIAAACALVFFSAVMLTSPRGTETAPFAGYPAVTLATDTVTPVKLMFASEETLEDARLSIQLPVGVELVGYDGRSNLSWTTDLEPGKNILRLPLVGRVPVSDQLVAKLEHPKGTKTFRLQVTVN